MGKLKTFNINQYYKSLLTIYLRFIRLEYHAECFSEIQQSFDLSLNLYQNFLISKKRIAALMSKQTLKVGECILKTKYLSIWVFEIDPNSSATSSIRRYYFTSIKVLKYKKDREFRTDCLIIHVQFKIRL